MGGRTLPRWRGRYIVRARGGVLGSTLLMLFERSVMERGISIRDVLWGEMTYKYDAF